MHFCYKHNSRTIYAVPRDSVWPSIYNYEYFQHKPKSVITTLIFAVVQHKQAPYFSVTSTSWILMLQLSFLLTVLQKLNNIDFVAAYKVGLPSTLVTKASVDEAAQHLQDKIEKTMSEASKK